MATAVEYPTTLGAEIPELLSEVEDAVLKGRDALLSLQQAEDYWCFELEADCTIPAEYILMMHYLGEIDEELQMDLARYLRQNQGEDGGWPLFRGGVLDVSCSVKVYYALKLAGDSPDYPHMVRARNAILGSGGAARSNVFTRMSLALFGQIPWRAVPFTPVEIILLPRWFPFHISKVSYWSRTVVVPLTILCSLKPRAKNPMGIDIRELFTVPPEREANYFPVRSSLNRFFLFFDRAARFCERFIPAAIRRIAVRKAEIWLKERLNGEHGLGAIFPAMVNVLEVLALLGYPPDHPLRRTAKGALQNLLVRRGESVYCQPCVSPIWDTALASLALLEEGSEISRQRALRALQWLKRRQLTNEPGDWRENHPELPGGGWPFQFQNSHYPDLDDTAAVAWAMHQSHEEEFEPSIRRGAEWVCGMQSKNGGFASFDADNTHFYLNEIPFADHGALLDPPTSDVTARCAALLALIGKRGPELNACLQFLRKEQEPNGPWFGRWGTNYIYGTWSVLEALEKSRDPRNEVPIRAAAAWLKKKQRTDGGWGEDCATYFFPQKAGEGPHSTSFQTAWAVLGLIAAGEGYSEEVRRGVSFLLRNQQSDGLWQDDHFTAPGFPRVFYLKYHGYSAYFPFWALARYRNLYRQSIA